MIWDANAPIVTSLWWGTYWPGCPSGSMILRKLLGPVPIIETSPEYLSVYYSSVCFNILLRLTIKKYQSSTLLLLQRHHVRILLSPRFVTSWLGYQIHREKSRFMDKYARLYIYSDVLVHEPAFLAVSHTACPGSRAYNHGTGLAMIWPTSQCNVTKEVLFALDYALSLKCLE